MIEESPRSISFPVIKLSQPIGDFYIGAIAARDLVEIAYFDIRQLNLKGNIDTYLGIQRRLNESRIREISQYVNTVDATFPTAVILAVEEKCASIKELKLAGERRATEPFYELTLQNFPGDMNDSNTVLFRDIARVIDGQHRIAGLMNLASNQKFEINVAIFVGADIADQAAIFSTVNLAQTKVNRSLVYDLFEYSKTRSPEKTCHDVAVMLDRVPDSPFHEKIKRLGVATKDGLAKPSLRLLLSKLCLDISPKIRSSIEIWESDDENGRKRALIGDDSFFVNSSSMKRIRA